MFEVNGQTIRMSRGDTGVIAFIPIGITLTEKDRAVFTVRRRNGGMLLQKVITPQEGRICMALVNEETQQWRAGMYEWDIRVVMDAVQDEDGRVTDGREVLTPYPPSMMIVESVVGDV